MPTGICGKVTCCQEPFKLAGAIGTDAQYEAGSWFESMQRVCADNWASLAARANPDDPLAIMQVSLISGPGA
jgi:hypothetical protein